MMFFMLSGTAHGNRELRSAAYDCFQVLEVKNSKDSEYGTEEGYFEVSIPDFISSTPGNYLLKVAQYSLENRKKSYWIRYNKSLPNQISHIPVLTWGYIADTFYSTYNAVRTANLKWKNFWRVTKHELAASEWIANTSLFKHDLIYRTEVRSKISQLRSSVIMFSKEIEVPLSISPLRDQVDFLNSPQTSQDISLNWLNKIETAWNTYKEEISRVEKSAEQTVKMGEIDKVIEEIKKEASQYPKGFLEAESKVQTLYQDVKGFETAINHHLAEIVNIDVIVSALESVKKRSTPMPFVLVVPQLDISTLVWQKKAIRVTIVLKENLRREINDRKRQQKELKDQLRKLELDYAKNIFFLNEVNYQFKRDFSEDVSPAIRRILDKISQLALKPHYKASSLALLALTRFKLDAFSKDNLDNIKALKDKFAEPMSTIFSKSDIDKIFDNLGINVLFGSAQKNLDSLKKSLVGLLFLSGSITGGTSVYAGFDTIKEKFDDLKDWTDLQIEWYFPEGEIHTLAQIVDDKKLKDELGNFFQKHTPQVLMNRKDPSYKITDKSQIEFYLKYYPMFVDLHVEAYKQYRLGKKINLERAEAKNAFTSDFFQERAKRVEIDIDLIDIAALNDIEKFKSEVYKYFKKYYKVDLNKYLADSYIESIFYLKAFDVPDNISEIFPNNTDEVLFELLDLRVEIEEYRTQHSNGDLKVFKANLYKNKRTEVLMPPNEIKFQERLVEMLE
ncbi:MAG: hypothetical protein KDD58_00170 [Bdellovibrionales bacterium]|nr:hypothetical protein [Bdellovibrionales bacterium]